MEIDNYHYGVQEVVRRMDEGYTRARLCLAEDRSIYVVKALDEVPAYELIAEWICGHLAHCFGLPVPPCKLVIGLPKLLHQAGERCNQPNDSVGFASQFQRSANTLTIEQARTLPAQLKTDILVFDAWIKNGDRTLSDQGGNVNLLADFMSERGLWVFDHNQALNPNQDLAVLATHHVFSGANAGLSLDDLVLRAEYEAKMEYCLTQLPQVIAELPQSWRDEANERQSDGQDVIEHIVLPLLARYNAPNFWSWITP
ncbi:MAG: HipA family kinase [Aeromonas sp.]